MLKSLAVAAVAVVSIGCSGNTTQTFSAVFEFHAATAPAVGTCTTVTETLDLTTINGFDDIKDRVQQVTIDALTVTVVNPALEASSVAEEVEGTVTVDTASLLGTYEPLGLTAGNSQDVPIEAAGIDRFNDLATAAPYVIPVTATGCADQYPAHFSLEGEMTATVRFKVL